MKISIIIPVYNASKWLRYCLDSIVYQDFDDYEVLVVDDGSNDGSGEICDEYAAMNTRFRVFHKTNGGVSSARNFGLEIAVGEYVMFVDADDALLPGALRFMSTAVGGADFLLSGHIVCDDVVCQSDKTSGVSSECDVKGDDRTVKDVILPEYDKTYVNMVDFWSDNLKRNCPTLDAPWAKLFKRSYIEEVGLRFCEELKYAEDKLFVFNYLVGCKNAVVLKCPLYQYVVHSGSLGSDISSDKHLAQLRVFLPKYSDVIRRLMEVCPASNFWWLYHYDLVGRYVCRILNIFMTRKTEMLNEEYLGWVYGLMSADKRLGVFSLRPGQIFNILLYKLGNVCFSLEVYRLLSHILPKK